MNSVKLSNLIESEIDSLIELIILNNNLIFEKNVEENFKKYKQKIIDLIISNDYIEQIPKLKKIYLSDPNTINIITESLINVIHEISLDSIEWIITNETELFNNLINKINLQKFMKIIDSDNFDSIYKSIKVNENENILNIFENKIFQFLELKFPPNLTNLCQTNNFIFFKIFEKTIILVDLYQRKKFNNNIKNFNINKCFNEVHSKIIYGLLKANTSLDIIIKYKKYYKIPDENIKNYFEKNLILENIIRYSSVEIINWFFEIASILVIIKASNYKNIFKQACLSGNIELIKLTYNLIECAGFKIDESYLYSIISQLIYEERWNNHNIQYDNIIYEFINMGIKPPSGISKYTEYYKNIIMIKK
jgi:hypothetical protein